MKYLIVPLTKSPHESGRIGPEKYQDWYRGLRLAAKLQSERPGSKILVISNFQAQDHPREADIYSAALETMVLPETIRVIRDAYETTEQLGIVEQIMRKEGGKVVIISTFLHYLRVRWLTRGKAYEHHVAFGIPRPKEVVTDMILTFLFPMIDLLGKRRAFFDLVKRRRQKGKF